MNVLQEYSKTISHKIFVDIMGTLCKIFMRQE